MLTFSRDTIRVVCSLHEGEASVKADRSPESRGGRRVLSLAARGFAGLLIFYLVSLGPVSVYAIKYKSFSLLGYLYPLLWLRTTPLQPAVDAYISFWEFLLGNYI